MSTPPPLPFLQAHRAYTVEEGRPLGKGLGNGRRKDEEGHLDVNLERSPLTKPTPGLEPGTASWELVQIAYHILKPGRLIFIGTAAFGEASKQLTTKASASPGYRYLQRRSTQYQSSIEHRTSTYIQSVLGTKCC